MTTSNTGTGTITLGSAVSNFFLTFAEAGVANGNVVSYCIEDGTDFEIGIGTYTSSGTTLSRDTVRVSKIGGTAGTSKLNLSGNATVFLCPDKEDLLSISENAATNQIFAGPASGGAAPPAFRALVGADAPGPSTRQYLLSGTGATYTTPAGCRLIIVKFVGGGGGAAAIATNNGTAGTDSSFNSVVAKGGGGGVVAGAGGIGGTGGTGSAQLRIAGSNGSAGGFAGGGGTPFGSGAGARSGTGAGINAAANTGAGGSSGISGGVGSGAGGGAEYVELVIPNPAATYTYTVGPGGNGGAAGTQAGGNGGSGIIVVEEYYF